MMACFDSSPLCMEFNEEYEASIASSIVVPAPLFQQECALIQRRHRPANLRKNQAQKFAPIPRVVITQVDFSSGPSLWNWRIAAHGLVAINIRLLTADVVSAQAKQPTGTVDWLRVDASSPVESIVSRVLAAILG
jgi:hypothetical protein